jgi:predicted alpha/beta hydrolase
MLNLDKNISDTLDKMEISKSCIITKDGVSLCIKRLEVENSSYPPVIISQGTFSNTSVVEPLAQYLQDHGFDCWVFDYRDHGDSGRGSTSDSYERVAELDVQIVVDTVIASTGRKKLFWIGHSSGGIMPLLCMARIPKLVESFQGIALIASQTTHAYKGFSGKASLVGLYGIVKLLGKAPGKLLKLGPEDEMSGVLKQWLRWNWSGDLCGADGFKYEESFGRIDIPVIGFASLTDSIAPSEGCEYIMSILGSSDKTFINCNKRFGHSEDYNHARLIKSKSASNEVWPVIKDWLVSKL